MKLHLLSRFVIANAIIISFFSSGCIRTAENIEVPKVNPKLVVFCMISPDDSVITANVYKSRPLYEYSEPESNQIEDATVEISDGNESIILPFVTEVSPDNIYDLSSYKVSQELFPIVPGKEYRITVSTSEGLHATASTIVPRDIPTEMFYKIDTLPSNSSYGYYGTQFRVDVSWNDISANRNYYRLTGEANINNSCRSNSKYYTTLYFDNYEGVLSNSGIEGKTLRMRNGRFSSDCFNNSGNDTLLFHLLNTDEHYYQYYLNKNNYSEDDPFSEPLNMKTNVEGGLGVFASYRQFTQKIPLIIE